jgi:hypothetical protein
MSCPGIHLINKKLGKRTKVRSHGLKEPRCRLLAYTWQTKKLGKITLVRCKGAIDLFHLFLCLTFPIIIMLIATEDQGVKDMKFMLTVNNNIPHKHYAANRYYKYKK